MELLQIFIPTSIALTAVFIAIRGRYIHDFRTYGLDFSDNWRLYKASKDKETADAYKEIAKSWIIHSLQYKCKALFLTFSIVYMFLAFIFSLLAIPYAIIPPYEIIRLSAILFPVVYFAVIVLLQYKENKALSWTQYMFPAVIFSLTAILYAIIPLDGIILFPAFYFAIIAFCVLFFEERLHSPKGKWRKIGFIFPNPLVSRILKKTPFGIQYLSSWGEIKEPFENKKGKIKSKNELKKFNSDKNELKEFIVDKKNKKNDYFIQPLKEYNLLPWPEENDDNDMA